MADAAWDHRDDDDGNEPETFGGDSTSKELLVALHKHIGHVVDRSVEARSMPRFGERWAIPLFLIGAPAVVIGGYFLGLGWFFPVMIVLFVAIMLFRFHD